MEFWLILATALAPALVLIVYIYRCDKSQPEPWRMLFKAFMLGIFSTVLSLAISQPLELFGWFTTDPTDIIESLQCAFLGAAVPEETAKLIMLWLLLRRNPYFDERIDGIVYAVMVGMGFAAAENVLYLFSNYDSWMTIGITRAIFSVPGHFCFAVAMGYFYALAVFTDASGWTRLCVWLIPVLLHGIFDALLFVQQTHPGLQGILLLLFLVFCHWLRKKASRRIERHLQSDANDHYWQIFNNRFK